MSFLLHEVQIPDLLSRHLTSATQLIGGNGPDAAWARAVRQSVYPASKGIAEAVYAGALPGPAPLLQVRPADLDLHVDLHLDRWIETAARHAAMYAGVGVGSPPGVTQPSRHLVPPALRQSLSGVKTLSGDMSGVIGEALFVGALRGHFGLGLHDFVHLRPSSLKRFPDFAVLRPGALLGSALGVPTGGAVPFAPFEVKTVSDFSAASKLSPILADATVQLLSFWLSVGGPTRRAGPSGIFVALRNRTRQSYDLLLVTGD